MLPISSCSGTIVLKLWTKLMRNDIRASFERWQVLEVLQYSLDLFIKALKDK